jgi:protein-S-isoprenylcysteine O-methyltransferase Ste14
MGRLIVFIYGAVSYVIFFLTFLYLIAFVGNLTDLPYVGGFITNTIDQGNSGSLGQAMLVNVGLISLFGISHSVMARPWFKDRWTKIVPKSAERSTYVLVSSLVLILMFREWIPMTDVVWDVSGTTLGTVLLVGYFLGYGIVLLSTFLINHFDLFGLSQIMANMKGETIKDGAFVQPLLYKISRHPLYLGFIIAFWSAQTMTVGHLLLSFGFTAYILAAIPFEEADLEAELGDEYRNYKGNTPMLIPGLKIKD